MFVAQAEQQIEAVIGEWERSTGEEFHMYGKKYSEYIRQQWSDHGVKKEAEKQLRVCHTAPRFCTLLQCFSTLHGMQHT